MPLTSSFHLLRDRWKTFAVVFVIVVLAAVAVTLVTPNTYTATAQVLVTAKAQGNASVRAQANNYVQAQVSSYARVIDSPAVVSYIRSTLDPNISDKKIKSEVAASSEVSSSIIDIVVTDGSASRSADLANAAAHGFVRAIQRYDSSTRLFLTGPAQRPSSASSPQPFLNIVLGVLLGLVLGAVAAGLRAAFDGKLRRSEELAAVSPLLGVIPNDSRAKRFPSAASDSEHPVRANAFRQLRTSVSRAMSGGDRVITVTSPLEGAGTTSVAINLAEVLAESGHRVCLVDASVQRPSIQSRLDLQDGPGLIDVLARRADALNVLQDLNNGVHVMTAGTQSSDCSGLIASPLVSEVFRTLAEFADYVVVDAAALLPTADGGQIASATGSALLVTRHGKTARTDLARACDALRQVDADVLGIVLNRVPRRRRSDRRGYGYLRDFTFDDGSYGRHSSRAGGSSKSTSLTIMGGRAS